MKYAVSLIYIMCYLLTGIYSPSALIFAAHDTTSGGLTRTLHVLSLRQDLQSRLRAEALAARERAREQGQENGDIEYDELMKLPLLDATVKEVLRLYPPVASLPRMCVLFVSLSSLARLTDRSLVSDTIIRAGQNATSPSPYTIPSSPPTRALHRSRHSSCQRARRSTSASPGTTRTHVGGAQTRASSGRSGGSRPSLIPLTMKRGIPTAGMARARCRRRSWMRLVLGSMAG